MTKRISELPAAGGIADADEIEVNQSGVSRKATRGQVIAGLAAAAHLHDLADLADAGGLAALDTVGTAEIDAAAYASQSEAVAGTENARIMTALRTAEAIAARAAAPVHQHDLADITDAGALAGLDAIRPTEIDPSAYATQIDAAEGLDGTRIMTAGRTAEAIAARAAPQHHQHDLADIADAGALAALDAVGTAEITAAAYASQSEAVAGTDNTKIMTALRTAEAIAAQPAGAAHQHELADITDAGALAALDSVGIAEIDSATFVEILLDSRPHPEQGFRSCVGVLSLVKRYGPDRVEAACERALRIQARSYSSVVSILKNNLDRRPQTAAPDQPPLLHANIRGPGYYH